MALSIKLHQGQLDEYGLPFVIHPFTVAEQMQDETSTCVALLHDSIAMAGMTFADLLAEGFPKDIADAVLALTKMPGLP